MSNLGDQVNPDDQFWYNVRTGMVERGMLSPATERVGPFATEAEAAKALDILRERSAAWAAEDAEEDA